MRTYMPLASLVLLVACGAPTDHGDPDLTAGDKADSLLDATAIAYGDTKSGSVADEAFTLFKMSAEEGDRFQVEVKRTSGDFDPRSVVYNDALNSISHVSGSFEGTSAGNIKTFEISGPVFNLFLVVRANSSDGSGKFDVTLTCVGGPCAGEGQSNNDHTDLGICLGRARDCAFARLDSQSPTNTTQALALMNTCLEESADDVCATACSIASIDGDEFSPNKLCNSMADALVFYAGKDTTCRSNLTFCLDACTERGQNSEFLELGEDEFEFFMTDEAICWENRFGDSCDAVARQHEDCGGTTFRYIDGIPTAGTCFAEWRADAGAWFEFEDDNIDCGFVCEAASEACTQQCANEPDGCRATCISNQPLLQDDFASVCDVF